MKKAIILYPDIAKDSANELADALGIDRENPYETKNRHFLAYDTVIRYGFSRPVAANSFINHRKGINRAINKLKVFSLLKDSVKTLEFTEDINVAKKWLKDGHYAVARAKGDSSNGIGVSYCDTLEELEEAPALFWTKYVFHEKEYRVNFWRDEVISVYDKIVPNHDFKFKLMFSLTKHPQLLDFAEKIYDKIGLDFYGADFLCDEKGTLHLLEINSSPVLFPHTIKKLKAKLEKELQND